MTSRTSRTTPTTTRSERSSFKIWIDYLLWNNWWSNQIVEDETWESISIYADSWYTQIDNSTSRTARTPI